MDAERSSLALELATAAGFVVFAGGFWLVASLGQWALAPIDHVAAAPRVRTRFSLGEMLLLVVQVQVAVGGCCCLAAGERPWTILSAALASGSVVAMWCSSLRRLTTCGVTCVRRRAMFLGLVAPLTCAALFAGLWFNGNAVIEIARTSDFATTPWLLGNAAALTAFLVCRRLTLSVFASPRTRVVA